MPIVSHTIESTTQADGSLSNVLRLYDQDGTEYLQQFPTPPGFDVPGLIVQKIAELNEQLAQDEVTLIFGA